MSRNELCVSKSNEGLDVLVERARTLMENARSKAKCSGYARDFSEYEFFAWRTDYPQCLLRRW